MSLFDNASNLFELFSSKEGNPEKAVLAEKAGVSQEEFSKITSQGIPAILQGINQKTSNESDAKAFDEKLTEYEDADQYESITALAQDADAEDGDRLLDSLFDNKNDVFNGISKDTGISVGSVQKVLGYIAPIIMKFFGEQKKNGKLNLSNMSQSTNDIFNQVANNSDILGSLLGRNNNEKLTGSKSDVLDNVKNLFK